MQQNTCFCKSFPNRVIILVCERTNTFILLKKTVCQTLDFISHNSAAVNCDDSTKGNGATPVPLAESTENALNQQKSYRVSSTVCNYFFYWDYYSKLSIIKVNLCVWQTSGKAMGAVTLLFAKTVRQWVSVTNRLKVNINNTSLLAATFPGNIFQPYYLFCFPPAL